MEKAWASSLAKASLIAAIKARMGFSSLACIVESAPRLSGEIANTTSAIAKRSWRECVMAVWDSTVDCDQSLVRSPPNETELSAGPPRPVNYGEHGNMENCFIKSNVRITTASGWLGRLVRSLVSIKYRRFDMPYISIIAESRRGRSKHPILMWISRITRQQEREVPRSVGYFDAQPTSGRWMMRRKMLETPKSRQNLIAIGSEASINRDCAHTWRGFQKLRDLTLGHECADAIAEAWDGKRHDKRQYASCRKAALILELPQVVRPRNKQKWWCEHSHG